MFGVIVEVLISVLVGVGAFVGHQGCELSICTLQKRDSFPVLEAGSHFLANGDLLMKVSTQRPYGSNPTQAANRVANLRLRSKRLGDLSAKLLAILPHWNRSVSRCRRPPRRLRRSSDSAEVRQQRRQLQLPRVFLRTARPTCSRALRILSATCQPWV